MVATGRPRSSRKHRIAGAPTRSFGVRVQDGAYSHQIRLQVDAVLDTMTPEENTIIKPLTTLLIVAVLAVAAGPVASTSAHAADGKWKLCQGSSTPKDVPAYVCDDEACSKWG